MIQNFKETTPTSPIIHLDNITISFGAKTILNGFSLKIQPGEMVTLTGDSGSGKSTVLRSILGFVAPSSGSVSINGEELNANSVWRHRRNIAYVAQEPDLGFGTVQEILKLPFAFKANSHIHFDLADTENLFELLLLSPQLLYEDVTKLSGGEKQRVALISAILLKRKIFLLDEIASALDRSCKQALTDYFNSQTDLTVLSMSHDAVGVPLSDRVFKLKSGVAEEIK